MFAVVHYPEVDTKRINRFRRKYDPQVDLIEPHITLVFPVTAAFAKSDLIQHIETVLNSWQPFAFHLYGFQKSSDGYLFLAVEEGNQDLVRLHDELNTAVLGDQWDQAAVFVPHVTLGVFGEDENAYARALEEAQQLEFDYRCMFDNLHLIEINDDRTQIIWTKAFRFAS